MFHKDYSNFVKSVSPDLQSYSNVSSRNTLDGEEAKRLYLEEVEDVKDIKSLGNGLRNEDSTPKNVIKKYRNENRRKRKLDEIDTSNTKLFLSAQNNDVSTLSEVLNTCPDKISTVDEFGWSLLMIACQANSVDVVKELLKRGIDSNVRDKAGNSARTLVIKNKNLVLADILLNSNNYELKSSRRMSVRLKEEYKCETCNNIFQDKQDHLSSTIHNINASKGKKIPAQFKIPPSNIGYQIMLKDGWDNESGLGRDGCGKKYPVKAVQKLDRKGLGLEKKRKEKSTTEKTPIKTKLNRDYHENRRFEVNFRREFY